MLNLAKLIRRVKRKDICFLWLNVLKGAVAPSPPMTSNRQSNKLI